MCEEQIKHNRKKEKKRNDITFGKVERRKKTYDDGDEVAYLGCVFFFSVLWLYASIFCLNVFNNESVMYKTKGEQATELSFNILRYLVSQCSESSLLVKKKNPDKKNNSEKFRSFDI
jgi:hypothetical protein